MDILSFALFPLIIQIVLIIHAFKHQKPYFWIFLLIFVPGISSIIYILLEFLPEVLNKRDAQVAGQNILKAINPERDIRRLQEQLDTQDTVGNRISLAEAYFDAEQYDNAIIQYRDCLSGPYSNDRTILFPLARALYFSGDIGEAKKIISQLKTEKNFVLFEEQLLDILVRETNEDVLSDFELLYERTRNFEAGFYYVRALMKKGNMEQAKAIVNDMKTTLRKFSQFRTTMGREWLIKSEAALRISN